jgi:hypothetical protein
MTIVIALLCVLTGCLLFALKRERHQSQCHAARSVELSKEIDFYRERLGVIHLVIAGVTKQISEYTEILEAFKSTSPELFGQHPTLKYWLSANNEFFVELYDENVSSEQNVKEPTYEN